MRATGAGSGTSLPHAEVPDHRLQTPMDFELPEVVPDVRPNGWKGERERDRDRGVEIETWLCHLALTVCRGRPLMPRGGWA